MKYLRWLILAALLLAPPIQAQVVADTLRVTIEGDLAGVSFTVFSVTLTVGDTVQYVAQAYDEDGDPITTGVVYTYASSDTTLLRILPASGWALALQKGNVDVIVRAEYGGLIVHVASFRDGELTWGSGNIEKGQTLQYCAYIVDGGGYLVGQSQPPPICPIAFLPRPEAEAHPMFASVSRVRPELFVFTSAGQN